MNTELEHHDDFVDYLNELLANPERSIVGMSTKQYENDDDISVITIKIAPRDVNE